MKRYKYTLTIEFESEKPVKKHENCLIQFENGLEYFVDTVAQNDSVNNTFVYGTGKTKLKKRVSK